MKGEIATEFMPVFHSVVIYLTNRCNLCCRHCFASSSNAGNYGLKTDRVLKLINELKEELGGIRFSLSGGEPLVRKEDSLQILAAASSKHQVQLLTNGMLMDERLAEQFVQTNIHVRVSVDGANESSHDLLRGAGAFQKVMRGIEILQQYGMKSPHLSICSTLTPESICEVPDILKLANVLKIDNIRFNALTRKGRGSHFWTMRSEDKEASPSTLHMMDNDGDDYFAEYFKELMEAQPINGWTISPIDSLSALFRTLYIYPDGSAFPFIPSDDSLPKRDEKPLGNINHESLHKVLTSKSGCASIIMRFLNHTSQDNRPPRAFRAQGKFT